MKILKKNELLMKFISIFLSIFFLSVDVTAQELLPTEDLPEDIDTSSPDATELPPGDEAETENLFGTDELPELEAGLPTHNVRLEFNSTVSFTNPDEPSPYLEIMYSTLVETPVELNQQTRTMDLAATIDVQTHGSLAQNEFFECRLNIAFEQAKVTFTTKLNSEGSKLNDSGEEQAKTFQAVFRTSFDDSMAEDWFSYCTDISGATLNTVGAPENYNLQVLKMVEPDLKALVLDNFDPSVESRIPLIVPSQTVDDVELNNKVTLQGEGLFAIEPILTP